MGIESVGHEVDEWQLICLKTESSVISWDRMTGSHRRIREHRFHTITPGVMQNPGDMQNCSSKIDIKPLKF